MPSNLTVFKSVYIIPLLVKLDIHNASFGHLKHPLSKIPIKYLFSFCVYTVLRKLRKYNKMLDK